MNKFIGIGRATKDVELKQTSGGTFVAEFSIAVKRSFKSANGEYESDFFNCVAPVVREPPCVHTQATRTDA